ncbi:tripartite tricarboxylate transporter TctB family protein [Rhizohabitans arisaemae]|uniref:tripartite tricarboxylate transporter TctB family protein n=1 Tax=Rhizohabitans arisaemae TaxID=2720610 RepID=UPI0024B095D8|nr:tripartite tricarboxylate transporter TctB family protein [Rhizohabitans arisaemae]
MTEERQGFPVGQDGEPHGDSPAPTSSFWTRKSELVLAGVVLALGFVVLIGTADVATGAATFGPGPRFFPVLVGGALLIVGVCYVIDVLRGGHGDPEESEDVDTRAPADWRAVAMVTLVFLGFASLVDLLGWVVAGALLFFGLAFSLGARKPLRTGAIAVVLSFATYLLFVRGLGVTLPAGLLEGVL